jgi:uncharacterized membrane protein YccC
VLTIGELLVRAGIMCLVVCTISIAFGANWQSGYAAGVLAVFIMTYDFRRE